MATRTLEAYWQGFCAWLLASRRRGFGARRALRERIEDTALRVGEGLVAWRHSGRTGEARLALDQLELLVEVGADAGTAVLTRAELAHVREALRTARGMLPRERRAG